MPGSNNQKGVIPLIALIAAGIIAVVGGSYVIRNDLLNTNKITSKVSKETEKTDSTESSSSPIKSVPTKSKSGLSDKPFAYNPQQNTSNNTKPSKEPSFTITPPEGWVPYESRDDAKYAKMVRANFAAPEEDKIEIDPVTKAFLRFPALVEVLIIPTDHNLKLQELIDGAKEDARKSGSILISSGEITAGDIRGYSEEFKMPFKDIILTKNVTGTDKEEKASLKEPAWRHQITNIFAVDNFAVYVKGATLEYTWSKRAGEIKSSLDSFAFVGVTPKPEGLPEPDMTQATGTFSAGFKEDFLEKATYKNDPPPNVKITPPSNWWQKSDSNTGSRIFSYFAVSPDTDSETNSINYTSKVPARVNITLTQNTNDNLETLIIKYKRAGNIVSEKSISVGGKKGYLLEYKVPGSGGSPDMHYYRYIFQEGKYEINITGSSLESTWQKRSLEIKKVMESFSLTD